MKKAIKAGVVLLSNNDCSHSMTFRWSSNPFIFSIRPCLNVSGRTGIGKGILRQVFHSLYRFGNGQRRVKTMSLRTCLRWPRFFSWISIVLKTGDPFFNCSSNCASLASFAFLYRHTGWHTVVCTMKNRGLPGCFSFCAVCRFCTLLFFAVLLPQAVKPSTKANVKTMLFIQVTFNKLLDMFVFS